MWRGEWSQHHGRESEANVSLCHIRSICMHVNKFIQQSTFRDGWNEWRKQHSEWIHWLRYDVVVLGRSYIHATHSHTPDILHRSNLVLCGMMVQPSLRNHIHECSETNENARACAPVNYFLMSNMHAVMFAVDSLHFILALPSEWRYYLLPLLMLIHFNISFLFLHNFRY